MREAIIEAIHLPPIVATQGKTKNCVQVFRSITLAITLIPLRADCIPALVLMTAGVASTGRVYPVIQVREPAGLSWLPYMISSIGPFVLVALAETLPVSIISIYLHPCVLYRT